MTTFPHSTAITNDSKENIASLMGYTKAMSNLLEYLRQVTEYDPNKRMIDSVPLLNIIINTNADLTRLMKVEQDKLKLQYRNTSIIGS